ncbi:MAG: ClbS/DfsB family four-helix bundle protein [Anaerolineae bacterium]
MPASDVLQKIADAWEDFQASYAGLNDEQMRIPQVVGQWSVHDILAHVTTWEHESIKDLAAVRRGEPLPKFEERYGDLNDFNARMTEAKRGLSLAEVLDQLEDIHHELVEAIAAFPDQEQVAGLVSANTWTHYPEHAASIRAWRARLGI